MSIARTLFEDPGTVDAMNQHIDEDAVAIHIFGKIVKTLTEEFEPIWQGKVLKTEEGIEDFKKSIKDAIQFIASQKIEMPDNAIQFHKACQIVMQQLMIITQINRLDKITKPSHFRSQIQPITMCTTLQALMPYLNEVLVQTQATQENSTTPA